MAGVSSEKPMQVPVLDRDPGRWRVLATATVAMVASESFVTLAIRGMSSKPKVSPVVWCCAGGGSHVSIPTIAGNP